MLIFLDRDGVINEDSDNYIRSLADWHPIPGSLEAIADLSMNGYTVAIVTNQSGLGRGFFKLRDMEAIHHQLRQRVEQLGGKVAGIFYCPHLPDANCGCRKPRVGLLQEAVSELKLSAENAFLIGDSFKDLQAASAFDCRPVLVKTGKGLETFAQLERAGPEVGALGEVLVFADLAEASRAIQAMSSI